MSDATAPTVVSLRIGEVARMANTTARTIRYYEEIGLLESSGDREAGQHRLYSMQDVERLREALRLKELLGVTLDELKELLEAEEARAVLREEWHHANPPEPRRREILAQLLGHVDHQLELLTRRRAEIERLEDELLEKRGLIHVRMDELGG
jgi:DNA-binding transcriptional MerR regulator